ncbi:outer membrane assembly lipoprotein YfiO, partial [Pseudomonas aeruginosa]|nr:outer membrane assembly lipoprotein YfiO [Pseudomonas aeruginosa]
MRSKPLLPALLLVGAGLSPLAQASSDDSCYPDWSLVGGGVCDTLPFLAPGNDTRANLRLLLADAGHWRLVEAPPSEEEKLEGYGLVPFGLFRLLPGDGSQPPALPAASEAETPPPAPAPSPLAELARQMGAEALPEKIAGAEFFEGEGSRCRSNDQDSALAFLRQVRDAGLGEAETKALANSRLDLLGACGWEQEELGGVLAQGVESAAGKAFATYLEAAANFYSGRFDEAEQGFKALQDVSQPWLKETALYLQARTLLNAAQQNAFDDMGFPELQNVDKARLEQTRSALEAYLQAYPKGLYAASAKGLQRRVHWLAGDQKLLAQDYAAQFAEAEQGQRNMALEDLVQEVDNKLLTGIQLGDIQTPLLLAVADLVQMRAHDPSTPRSFTWETLQAQQASFAAHPELFAYLQAAYRFYVDQD